MTPLSPGDNRTLVSIPNNFHPDGFDPDHSSWSGSLPAGTYKLYAYVDSIDNSDPNSDGAVWEKSLEASLAMIDFVAGTDTGIIIGFLKGGPSSDVPGHCERFSAALKQISPHAERKRVRVLIEATNRYETAVANDLAAAVELVKPLGTDYLQILPDTFHMNIEEAQGSIAALKTWAGYYKLVHISDNNRFFPGFGAIDFNSILLSLKEIGYRGSMAIEGNIRNSFKEDIQTSVEYLVHLPLV